MAKRYLMRHREHWSTFTDLVGLRHDKGGADLGLCDTVLTAEKPEVDPYPKHLVTLGDLLRPRRLDLLLEQHEVQQRSG